MNHSDMDEVSAIFSCQSEIKIEVHSVSSPGLQMFTSNISDLLKILGENGQDEFWCPIVREIKHFRFDISAAPLTNRYLSDRIEDLYDLLKSKVPQSKLVYDREQSEMLSQLTEHARILKDNSDQSLLDTFLYLINQKELCNIAIAICETRLIPEVEETFRNLFCSSKINIVSPANLRESICYSELYCFGAPRWFPEYVFSAPRAKQIHLIKHKWISGRWEPEFVFLNPYKPTGSRNMGIIMQDKSTEVGDHILEDFLPRIDIKKIQDIATEQLINLVNDDDEIVIAKLFLLENDWATFLDTDESASVDIIDLDEDVTKRVSRVHVRDIQTGMYILLRTEGGGDYIVSVADQLMGNFKEKARFEQRKWKALLREMVKLKGEKEIINQLRLFGSNRASSGNLAHWMSSRGIKTEHYEDFRAIMRLIGLEKESSNLWHIMQEIRKAHTRAGFKIRDMLLEQVNSADLDELRRHGIMEFELADQSAGKLSAFCVKDIARETTEVIHWRIGVPFRIENG